MKKIINWFELNSLIGRLIIKKKPNLNKTGTNLLHIGCSNNKISGWINADFFPNFLPNFLRLSKYKNRPDWQLDLRYKLKCDNNVWDGVFTEHTLEHLYTADVYKLLKEIYRTMKSGAFIRIVVPDLEKYIKFYNGDFINKDFSKFNTGVATIHSLTQNYAHLSVWDFNSLKKDLLEIGFKNINKVDYKVGHDSRLFIEQESRKWESLYLEAQK